MNFSQALCFDDVLIKPRYSNISSRKEIETTIDLGSGVTLNLPVVSSPMDTVTEYQMATAMASSGGIGIIHRYNSIAQQARFVKRCKEANPTANIGFAIGVGLDSIERATSCVNAGANLVCVDVAHGHHQLVEHTIKVLRNTFGSRIHIMAGNVATAEGHEALSNWGADSVRVGIGGGSICSTRVQTGHGMPTFQSVLDCANHGGSAKIIADGGIRTSGDVVKAIAAGADAVMVGSILAGTDETPGEIVWMEGGKFKVYRGMASKDAQIDWRGHYSSDEGVTSHVPCKGTVSAILENLERGLRSGLSYSGCRNIKEMHCFADFVQQTQLGNIESGTHILRGR